MTEIRPDIAKIKYKIAGLKILMTTYYQRTKYQAEKYIDDCDWNEDEADGIINLGLEFYENIHEKYMPYADYDSIEYMYTGSRFHRMLLDFDGCMLHSSAVVVDGYAYLFSADSGTGKSTHTRQWLKHFGERAYIINDDKPALRCIDNQWYVYGTPWSGKTDLNVNACVKLGAIVFLERAEDNWIENISAAEAVPKFFKQTIRKLGTVEKMDMALNAIERVLSQNPVYKMGCNISDDAVVTAYEKIRRV